MVHKYAPVVLLGIPVLLVTCTSAFEKPVVNEHFVHISAQIPDFPIGASSVTWLPDGKLLIRPESASNSYARPGEPIPFLLLDDGELNLRYFPQDSRCMRMEYHVSGILPNGWLGLVQNCAIHERPHQGPTEVWTNVLAYDWESGQIEQLVAESLPPIGSRIFSWNPEMTRGVQEAGSLLGTIHWIDRDRAEPMDVIIQDGPGRWSLADNYQVMLTRDNENRDIGIACCPAWSPDGRRIAFFASSDAVGRSGISRATGEYKLYLMDVDSSQPLPALDNIHFPNRAAWSPDGRWLAFTGIREDSCEQDECLWLFSPEDSALILVSGDPINNFSWSPDGGRLVATRECETCQQTGGSVTLEDGTAYDIPECVPEFCAQIVIYDASEIVTNVDDAPGKATSP